MSYTNEQEQVIEHGSGHAIVAAVAGSGKTHTMVGRIHVVEPGSAAAGSKPQ